MIFLKNVLFIQKLSSSELTIIILFIIACLGIVLYFFINFLLKKIIEERNKRYHKTSLLAYKSFVLDFKKNKIRYFNTSKINVIKEGKLQSFFDIIQENDRKLFEQWIDSLFENDYAQNDKSIMLLLNLRIKTFANKKFYSKYLLKAYKVVKDTRLIYLSLIRLKKYPLESKNNILFNKKPHKYLVSFDECKLYFKQNFFNRGNMYLIQINSLDTADNTFFNKKEIYSLVLNKIFSFFKKETSLFLALEPNENTVQFFIFETHFLTGFQLNTFLEEMANEINKIFEISSYSRAFGFRIVGSKTTELSTNFEENIKTFINIEKFLEDDLKIFTVYKKQSSELQAIDYSSRSAAEYILKNKNINVAFRSIIHVASKRVMTYAFMYFLSLKSQYFNNYDEFKKLIEKNNRKKDLISLEAKKIIQTFINQKETTNVKLIYSLSLEDLKYTSTIFSHIGNINEANLVLTFLNNEFIDSDDDDYYVTLIKSLKEKGYECGLKVSLNDYTLKEGIYNLFDMFFFDLHGLKNFKQNTREFLSIHSLLEKFLKYKKPLILINCPSWNSIELLAKSGITYFSSDVITPKSPMLLPLDKKVTKKLLNMYKS